MPFIANSAPRKISAPSMLRIRWKLNSLILAEYTAPALPNRATSPACTGSVGRGIGTVSVVVLSARYADSAATINVDSPRSLR